MALRAVGEALVHVAPIIINIDDARRLSGSGRLAIRVSRNQLELANAAAIYGRFVFSSSSRAISPHRRL
jgi:hypothetical protein